MTISNVYLIFWGPFKFGGPVRSHGPHLLRYGPGYSYSLRQLTFHWRSELLPWSRTMTHWRMGRVVVWTNFLFGARSPAPIAANAPYQSMPSTPLSFFAIRIALLSVPTSIF